MSRNFIVLDTETAPTVNHKDDQAHPETSRVYDAGWIIANKDGEELGRRSFVVSETFYNSSMMRSAYYADKLPQYREGICHGEWEIASFIDVWRTMKNDIKEYDVRDIWAFNARFDEIALNTTIRAYSNGFAGFFFPYKTRVRDIWDFAGSTICNTKKYVKWCVVNGRLTASGNPQTNAETVFAYLKNNLDFVERHTALSDCEIELAILQACFKRKQKARQSKGQGWRDAAKIIKEI